MTAENSFNSSYMTPTAFEIKKTFISSVKCSSEIMTLLENLCKCANLIGSYWLEKADIEGYFNIFIEWIALYDN